jgi:hypothetical protein
MSNKENNEKQEQIKQEVELEDLQPTEEGAENVKGGPTASYWLPAG